MARAALALWAGVVGCSRGATGGADVSRYPGRIPEWLWQDPRHAGLVSPALRAELERDVRRLESMRVFGETPDVVRQERVLARKLAGAFSAADLGRGAPVVADPGRGLALAVVIDPAFDEQARRTLLEASRLFVRCALDDGVVGRALAAAGRNDAADFVSDLRLALSARGGEPALLVISRYTGNAWWGGAKLNFFHDPTYRLSRAPPPRGYLYIRLNADRLGPGEPHGQDVAFWAGKIAHEALHNLGYSHPRYSSAAERDARNRGTRKAFVVAYERAVFAACK